MKGKEEFIPTPQFENTLSSADSLLNHTFLLMPAPEKLSDEQITATRAKLGRMTMALVEHDERLGKEQERRGE